MVGGDFARIPMARISNSRYNLVGGLLGALAVRLHLPRKAQGQSVETERVFEGFGAEVGNFHSAIFSTRIQSNVSR